MILQDSLVLRRISRCKGQPRVFLLGLDGAEPSLVLDNPQLPNLQTLARQGTCGELVSVDPPITAPAWASLFTGKEPGNHGILDFRLPLKCHNCGREPIRWEFYDDCPNVTHACKRS
jgi:arylsulfatase A-like enzyme